MPGSVKEVLHAGWPHSTCPIEEDEGATFVNTHLVQMHALCNASEIEF